MSQFCRQYLTHMCLCTMSDKDCWQRVQRMISCARPHTRSPGPRAPQSSQEPEVQIQHTMPGQACTYLKFGPGACA